MNVSRDVPRVDWEDTWTVASEGFSLLLLVPESFS